MSVSLSIDRAEFERLYKRWWPDVVALCGRLLDRSDEAEDVAQEAFLRAWIARDRYSSVLPFWPWLATIARRLCRDRGRRAGAEPVGDVLVTTETTPEQAVVAGDDLRAVLHVVEGMRPQERHVLMRRELDGWSYRHIASVEGLTVEAVRASLKRARASLRQSVLHEDGLEETGGTLLDRMPAKRATAR